MTESDEHDAKNGQVDAGEGVPGTGPWTDEPDVMSPPSLATADAPPAHRGQDGAGQDGAGQDGAGQDGAGQDGAGQDGAQPELWVLLEAVLLVTDEPVPAMTLAQVVEQPTERVQQALLDLAAEYQRQGRGFELRQVGGGWRFYTRADCAPWVERFVVDGQQARLTQAALETLAVIAYRQPVTRARVSAVRGVNVDGVVRSLVARGLLVDVGQDAETGGVLYATTNLLLEKLGIDSLDELPSLAPLLPELDDLDTDSMSR